tara:strand:- start:158 stop:442 length:285 start_codon:yes stop_codon:yes gene_type:complete
MKIRDLIELQEVIEKRTSPIDIHEYDFKYYSSSEDKERDILDMDLIHVIRALSKTNNISTKDKDIIEGQLSSIKNHVDNVRVLVNSIEEDIKDG